MNENNQFNFKKFPCDELVLKSKVNRKKNRKHLLKVKCLFSAKSHFVATDMAKQHDFN